MAISLQRFRFWIISGMVTERVVVGYITKFFFGLLTIFSASETYSKDRRESLNHICSQTQNITCQCGLKDEVFVIPVNVCLLNDSLSCTSCTPEEHLKNICARYRFCNTCRNGLRKCLTCPDGKYGDFCTAADPDKNEGKIQKLRKRDTSVPEICGLIPPPINGKRSCRAFPNNVTCRGSCRAGYMFLDQVPVKVHECNDNDGLWRPRKLFPPCEPICEQACQNGGMCVDNNLCDCTEEFRGNVCQYPIKLCSISKTNVASNWQCNHTHIETLCLVSCHPLGSVESLENQFLYECSLNGIWNPPLPRCVKSAVPTVLKCLDPGPVPNGVQSPLTSDFLPSSIINYRCNHQYVMQGNPTLTCGFDGKWSSEKPVCFRARVPTVIKCLDPGPVPNGVQSPVTSDFLPSSIINYRCNHQYVMQGNPTLTCGFDGKWSSEKPVCFRARVTVLRCPNPGPVPNGKWETSSRDFFVDSFVTFGCEDNYALQGQPTIFCLSDGKWSAAKPTCAETKAYCPEPKAPQNGRVLLIRPEQPLYHVPTFRSDSRFRGNIRYPEQGRNAPFVPPGYFPVDTKIQYQCISRYYKITGSSEYQMCLSTGSWSSSPPTCLPQCGISDSPRTPYITDGISSEKGQWPWQAALSWQDSEEELLICGGVLLNEQLVLTAAHCVTRNHSIVPLNRYSMKVYLGKYFRNFNEDDEYVQLRKVRDIYIHADYDPKAFDADIALLLLEFPVELTFWVQPICLPTDQTTWENLNDGRLGVVTGWGKTENGHFSEVLRQTTLPVVSDRRCEEGYRENQKTLTVTENMFCAGYDEGSVDTCNGDSGGPMVFLDESSRPKRWILEGIVSWGSATTCGKKKQYSGFTKVQRFTNWIKQFI